MFIMTIMMYRVVKLVTTLRPNLGFFASTPAPHVKDCVTDVSIAATASA